MPKAYSADLRKRVIDFIGSGHSCRAAASHFGVSISFAVRLMRTWREEGRIGPRRGGGWRHSKLEPHRAYLLARIAQQEDISMPELAQELAERGSDVAPASISRWFIRNGYRYKKNTVGHGTRTRPGAARPG